MEIIPVFLHFLLHFRFHIGYLHFNWTPLFVVYLIYLLVNGYANLLMTIFDGYANLLVLVMWTLVNVWSTSANKPLGQVNNSNEIPKSIPSQQMDHQLKNHQRIIKETSMEHGLSGEVSVPPVTMLGEGPAVVELALVLATGERFCR